MRHLLRRAVHAILVLLGVSILTFLFTTLAPGNYFDEMRLNPNISRETLAALRAEYDLDKPLPFRYARWVNSVLHGELGYSFAYNTPVAPLIRIRARNTLILSLTATFFGWALALPLGIWSAAQLGRTPDRILSWSSALLLSIPDVTIALAFLVFAVRTRMFPAGGMVSLNFNDLSVLGKLGDLVLHMFLPVSVLVLSILPVLLRHVRSSVADALDAPFLRAAEGHGISRIRLLWRYALPAAANPLISLFGYTLGTLLSASLLIEIIMSWPGLGPLLLEAILARDLYVVVGGVLLSTVFLVAGNFVADVLLYWSDPRIRTAPAAS